MCFAELSLFLWARCPPCDIRQYHICMTFTRRNNFLFLQEYFFFFSGFCFAKCRIAPKPFWHPWCKEYKRNVRNVTLQMEAVANSTGDEVPFDGHLSMQMMDLDRQALKAVATATSSRVLKEWNASKDGKEKKKHGANCLRFACTCARLLRSSPCSLGKPGFFFSCIHVHFRSVFFALAFFISKPVASGMFYFF